MLYTFGVFGEAIGGGQLAIYRRRRALDRKLDRISGHVIVCAYGRVGNRVVSELERDGVALVVVENNPGPAARLEVSSCKRPRRTPSSTLIVWTQVEAGSSVMM